MLKELIVTQLTVRFLVYKATVKIYMFCTSIVTYYRVQMTLIVIRNANHKKLSVSHDYDSSNGRK